MHAPAARGYADLHEHLDRLDRAGLLHRIDAPVNKDTEMHPLVRWQFRGGIPERDRKAFLFTNVIDSRGRRYDIPVAIGAFAANPAIYCVGMNVALQRGHRAAVGARVCQPDRAARRRDGAVPGYRHHRARPRRSRPRPRSVADPDLDTRLRRRSLSYRDLRHHPRSRTGIANLGTYRGQLKSPTRLGMMTLVNVRAGGYEHWRKYQAKGERMPIAIVVGCPPVVAFMGPQKPPHGVDELTIAGGLAGAPINVVRAKTVDLLVPAESEVVIEGFADPDYLEPEGPFGESHGYVALEDYNLVIEVTAITRRRNAIVTSIISQVTPSESSVDQAPRPTSRCSSPICATRSASRESSGWYARAADQSAQCVILQFAAGSRASEVWRALNGEVTLQAIVGKFVIAVDEDIDPENADAVFWAMSYRCNPIKDTHVVPYRDPGHGPRTGDAAARIRRC